MNVFEYALGSDPLDRKSVPDIQVKVIENEGSKFIGLVYKKMDNLSDVFLRIERSFDLRNWETGGDFTRLISNENIGNEYLTVTEISASPLSENVRQNIRLSIQLVR